MKSDKQQSSFVNIGSSSLLIIFLVLCLVTFAILSISSARSDHSFSEKFAERKTQYYDASAKASYVLDEIDGKLAELADANGANGKAAYIGQVIAAFQGITIDGVSISCDAPNGKALIAYQIPTDDKQVLEVKLHVTDYTQNGTYYEIKSWRVLSTDDWEGDQSLNLILMED